MAAANFNAALAFVWRPGFDNPRDGYHVTPGDPGGGTMGGVTEMTWDAACKLGLVRDGLKAASLEDLAKVLRHLYWNDLGDRLPPGVDFLVFNGRMMTGRFARLVQTCLGFTGDEVDGMLGAMSVAAVVAADAPTLIDAITGVHCAYLAELPTWSQFGRGWTTRLKAAQSVAHNLARQPPIQGA